MRYFLDTEFHEDGRTIDLISVGVVAEDGREFHAVSSEFDLDRAQAHPWLMKNVMPHLPPRAEWISRAEIADGLCRFFGVGEHWQGGEKPEVWAYYADYDWVALCQLFGPMIALPEGMPMFCRDLQQSWVEMPESLRPAKPANGDDEHDALADARWNRELFRRLREAS